MVADTGAGIPASATGPAAEARAMAVAGFGGQNPEQLTVQQRGRLRRGPTWSRCFGTESLTSPRKTPSTGPRWNGAWTDGQGRWFALSGRREPVGAAGSEHYIYLDQPELAVQAVQRVSAEAAR